MWMTRLVIWFEAYFFLSSKSRILNKKENHYKLYNKKIIHENNILI